MRLELKRPWSDGTAYLLFEPMEFLGKLADLTPRPEINLVLYHGVLAPRARWRLDVVAYRRTERDRARDPRAGGEGAPRPRYRPWALLMRRAIDLDVLRCPRCAGRMPRIATIDDPAVMQKILAHLGLPGARGDTEKFPLDNDRRGTDSPACVQGRGLGESACRGRGRAHRYPAHREPRVGQRGAGCAV